MIFNDLPFAEVPSDNDNQDLNNVGNCKVSLPNDHYYSIVAAKQESPYETPIPLLTFDGGTSENTQLKM